MADVFDNLYDKLAAGALAVFLVLMAMRGPPSGPAAQMLPYAGYEPDPPLHWEQTRVGD